VNLKVSKKQQATSETLSKFALAQAKTDDGKLDEAAALYRELAALSIRFSQRHIQFRAAKIYENKAKPPKPPTLLQHRQTASEAKDWTTNTSDVANRARCQENNSKR
jgi:hypothetical protein